MRKLLLTILIIVVLLVMAVVAAPFLIPREMLKAQIEKYGSQALGRALVVEGPMTLRPWRPFAVSLEGVRVANPDWAENPDLARIGRVDLDVDALAYLGGTVHVERLAIEQPVLALEVGPDGQAGWELGGGGEAGEASSADGDGGGGLPEIRLGDVALSDGALTYLDHATGERREFTDIALAAHSGEEAGALVIEGAATSDGEQATLNGRIGDLPGLLKGEPSSVDLDLAAPGLGVAAEGEASPTGTAVLAISADLAPRTLLGWLGQPLDLPDGALETVTLTVDLAAAPDGLGLKGLDLQVDELQVQGDLDLALGERPKLSGRLDLGDLDLRPYLPAEGEGAEAGAEEVADAAPASGWSEEPLDLPLPLPLDLDLELVLQALRDRTFETGAGRILVTADLEQTAVEIAELALYDGSLTGGTRLGSGQPLSMSATLDATGIRLLPVLEAAAGIDYVEGNGNLRFAVEGQGDSLKALIESLGGDGALLARDGAILGINIAATLRQVMTLGVQSAASEPQRTDFAEAGGTFTIEGGVLTNDDFNLRAPVLRIEGAGTVDLPQQALDYRLVPHVASTLHGQDAQGDPSLRLGVPLVISGAWTSPAIRLDLGGALTDDITDPAALAGVVGQIASNPVQLEALKESFGGGLPDALGGVLEGLSGGGDGGSGDAAPAEQLRDALGGILGR